MLSFPDIERTYGGGKKPLASRVPLSWEQTEHEQEQLEGSSSTVVEGSEAPTPSATEGRFHRNLESAYLTIEKGKQRLNPSSLNSPLLNSPTLKSAGLDQIACSALLLRQLLTV